MSPSLKAPPAAADDKQHGPKQLSAVSDVRDKLQSPASSSSTPCRYASTADTIKAYSSPLATVEQAAASQSGRPGILVSSLARAQGASCAPEAAPAAEEAGMLRHKLATAQEENGRLREALATSEQRASAYKGLVKLAAQKMDQLDYYKTQAELAAGRAEVFLQCRTTLVTQHKKELGVVRAGTQVALHRVSLLEQQLEALKQQQPGCPCGAPAPMNVPLPLSRLGGGPLVDTAGEQPVLMLRARRP